MNAEPYCLLLSADTPVFAHVRYAAQYLLEGTYAEGVELKVINMPYAHGIGTVAPDDRSVIQQVSNGRYEDEQHRHYKVLGGICDPSAPGAGAGNLTIVAAVVKRLGFLLLFPHGWEFSWDNLVTSRISSIWAHGVFTASNEQAECPSSSAQALSRIIKLWKASPDITLKGGPITDVPIPRNTDGAVDIVITTNYPEALKLAHDDKAVPVTAPDIFPEWSRLLLSALLTRQDLTAKEQNILEAVVIAINKACHRIHYEHHSASFANTLIELYPHVFNKEAMRIVRDVSSLLIDHGFIPQNIVTSRLGQLLSYCMWHTTEMFLPQAIIRVPRRDSFIGDNRPAVDYPICDGNFARAAYASSLSENIERRRERNPKVIIPLHGVLTHGQWHRRFADIAGQYDWKCRLDRWYYGWYPALRVLLPGSREGKVRWFVKTYYEEKEELTGSFCPCVIAHSFGTYVVGYALLLYPDLRFDRIILCGSILPTDYPWMKLIERGRVRAVLNQHSNKDWVAHRVGWFVADAGPSGYEGFAGKKSEEFKDEVFPLSGHCGYFEKHNMQEKWVTFLNRGTVKSGGEAEDIVYTKKHCPWGAYGLALVVLVLVAAIWYW